MLDDFSADNWFDVYSSFFVLVSLGISYLSLRRSTGSNEVSHLSDIIESQDKIWDKVYSCPELYRLLETEVDLVKEPITNMERRVALQLIMRGYLSYKAMENQHFEMGPMAVDIANQFRRPILNSVWDDVKAMYPKPFVAYIEGLVSKAM